MKKVKGLTKRIAAMLMSGMLVVGAVPGIVLASENQADFGQTSEIAAEVPEGAESEEVSEEMYSQDAVAQEEEAEAQYYAVTLDANGGYFENEWDDALGETVKQAEVVEKHIQVGGNIKAVPVFTEMDQDGRSRVFAGWSLERDGELVAQVGEEYAPVDNCVLYAIWDAEDTSLVIADSTENQDMELSDENTGEDDPTQESGNAITGEEEYIEEGAAFGTYTAPETEHEQVIITDQEATSTDENVKENSSNPSAPGFSEEETDLSTIEYSGEEEETVRDDARNGIVESGTCGNNLSWTLDNSGTLTISGTGAMSVPTCLEDPDSDSDHLPWFERGDDIITVIIEEGVTTIGREAFISCQNITTVSIPDTVTDIGELAFDGCISLSSITIPAGVTVIRKRSFQMCSSLTNVSIPDTVTDIEDYAFCYCERLADIQLPDKDLKLGVDSFRFTAWQNAMGDFAVYKGLLMRYQGDDSTVTVPANVTRIGTFAFEETDYIEKIIVPEGVTWIEDSAFERCFGLKEISLPSTLTYLGYSAFDECTDLESVIIPAGITEIKGGTFALNRSLSVVGIPETVTIIPDDAFEDCPDDLVIKGKANSYAQQYADAHDITFIAEENSTEFVSHGTCGDNLIWTVDEEGTLTISGTGEMEDYAWEGIPWGKEGIKNVIIKTGVTSIGDYAFNGCKELKDIVIPDGINSIGTSAFYGCNSLETILIPNTVTSISSGTFGHCNSLTHITLPSNINSIGNSAFYECCNLQGIVIPSSVKTIGDSSFYNCTNLERIILPDDIENIRSRTFEGCTNLNNIALPMNLSRIEYCAFKNCKSLTSITIPQNVKSIDSDAFLACSSLENVDFPSSINEIRSHAFSDCSSLNSIEFKEGLNFLGIGAFYNCSNLKNIYFKGPAPSLEYVGYDGHYQFGNVTATAYYPANDPTWTEEVRRNCGGDISWINYGGTDPIVTPDPDTFSLSIGTPDNNAVVIGEDGMLSAVAWYDFNNQDTALEEAQQINWMCSDPSAVEIYDPVYDLETKDVRISLSLRGKKPGAYTITGTSPDGRTASADVVVEPKIVAASNNTTLTETTDVVMVQTTLNTGDKAYLTSFLNEITGEIKDDYGTIGGADSKRVEVSEDGKTGKLIYTLTPAYGGNAEFTFTSPGGQVAKVIIYSDDSFTSILPGFGIPKDNFCFTNSVEDIGVRAGAPYPVDSTWLKFFANKKYTVSEVKSILYGCSSFHGVCAGMTSVMMQNYLGLFSPDSVQENANNLRDLNPPSNNANVKSLLGINQYCSITDTYFIKQDKFQKDYSDDSALRYLCDLAKEVKKTHKPVYVDFEFLKDYKSWSKDNRKGMSAHAMLVYGIETRSNGYEIDGNNYKYRVLTINPNYLYSENDIGEDYCIYISETYDNCIIPKSGTMADNVDDQILRYCGKAENIKNQNDFYFQYITNDINNLLPAATVEATERDPYFVFKGSFVESPTINDKSLEESSVFVRKVYPPFGAEDETPYYILNKGDYSIELQSGDEISLSSGDMFIVFDEDNGGNIRITEDNKVVFDSEGRYSISVTSNDLSVQNGDISTFILEGDKTSDIQIDFSGDDGVKLQGTIDSGSVMKYCSVDNEIEYTYHVEDSITDIIVSVDEEMTINYDDSETDEDLPTGCYIDTINISSNANEEIAIALDKSSYAFREGDVLTVDATIKTDKDRVEGQKEYTGYFAYYANEQWNQLASWDIEGGTTKYKLKLKKDSWEKNGDVMFTVSVFPKDSFTQGAALKDNVFLVNITPNQYSVKFDANGGFIHSEIDDVSGLEVTNAETVNKHIIQGGYVFIPSRHVQNEDDSLLLFGWSTTPDGDPVIGFNESYQPDGDCTLYAVWKRGTPAGTRSYGEFNDNGSLDLGDILKVKRHIQAFSDSTVRADHPDWILTGYDYEAADINHDTVIDDTDAGLIQQSIAAQNSEDVQAEHPDWILSETFEVYSFDDASGSVTGITLNKKSIVLEEGKEITLSAEVIPSDAVDRSIEWSSSNTDIVTVDNTGKVKGISEGKATITASSCDGSGVSATCEVTVNRSLISITDATVTGIASKTYNGTALTQNPIVKVDDKTLTDRTDYILTYANNTDAGTATVMITGKGKYTGTRTETFTINKAAQAITAKAAASSVSVGKTTTVSIAGSKGKKSYKSSNTAIATVTSTGKVTARKVGTVKITATSAATANYNAASKTVTVKVVPAATTSLTAANQVTGIKLTWKKVAGANGYLIYRGSTLIKTITSGNTVSFVDKKANTNGTRYVYKVVAKAATGTSRLSKSVAFYRVARPVISSLKNVSSKKMKVKWGKNAKATGYKILYSRSKTFVRGNKSVTFAGASNVSKVIGNLTKRKTYYVSVRAYKIVGGKVYWSEWSAVKGVKISK